MALSFMRMLNSGLLCLTLEVSWLRCETKFIMANPYPFICSVALISLQGLTFVLDKTCGFSFHDLLERLEVKPNRRMLKGFLQRNYIKFQHVIKHGTKYKLVLL